MSAANTRGIFMNKIVRFLTKVMLCTILALGIAGQSIAAGAYSGGQGGGNSWQYENVNDDAFGLYRKAKKNLRKKRFEKALGLLLKAEQRDTESADIQNLLGYTYRHLEKYDLSYSHYKKALTLDPEHVGATEYLGQLYVSTGRLNLANKQLAKLKMFCGVRCDEYQSLAQSITDNRKQVSQK